MKKLKKVSKADTSDDTMRLSRDHWLDAAYSAVADGGFDKVRVLAIAKTLGVTRGSFYWHFTDHADLVAALLQRWQQREQSLVRRLAAIQSDDAGQDLVQLLEATLASGGPDLENIRFELAVRAQGRRDPALADLLAEVDTLRIHMFEEKFLQLTRDAEKSSELAVLFYLTVAGSFQALARPTNPPQVRDFLMSIVSKYLVDEQRSEKS